MMLKLLKPGQDAAVQATEKAMVDHSNDGLRTLVIASRELEPEAYEAWAAKYGAAMADVAEHEKKERDEPNEIDRLGAELGRCGRRQGRCRRAGGCSSVR